MAYYQSNEPYNRQDGVMNGFFAGAFAGTAVAGAAHGGLPLLRQAKGGVTTQTPGSPDSLHFDIPQSQIDKMTPEQRKQMGIPDNASGPKKTFANKAHNTMFGGSKAGGWRKAAGYGASALAFGLVGAGVDAAND